MATKTPCLKSRVGEATLGDCMALWMEHQRARNKKATIKNARLRAQRVLCYLGDVPVSRITGKDLDHFVSARRRQGAKAATINCDLRVLRAVLRYAEADGLTTGPQCKIKMLRAPKRKIVEPFTPEEIARVMETAAPRERVLLAIASASGLRLDEILHLQWRDIEFRERLIHVREKRSVRRTRAGQSVEEHWCPKSHQARTVSIDAVAAAELRRYRMQQRWSTNQDWIFQSRNSRERWTCPFKAIRRVFSDAAMHEPGRSIHAIRHTFATRMLQNGTDLETVRDVLGHESVTTTELYLHTNSERKRAAADVGSLLLKPGRRG